jgi:hypothetical protein
MPVIGKKVAGFGRKNELPGPKIYSILSIIPIFTIFL